MLLHLPLSPFRRAAAEAVAAALGVDAVGLAVSTPPDPALGDFAVGCFSASRTLRAAPAALASRVAATFSPGPLLESAAAAGPYVNFRARRAALYADLFARTLTPGGTLVPAAPGAGQTVCIDYSSPNIAKPLSYHHIRSTVIGHALANLHRALGFRVVGINHLGDWGTTFGMILAAFARWGVPEPLTIGGMAERYVAFRKAAETDTSCGDDGRAWFKRLEDGDETARALWRRMREISLTEFDEVYARLGVVFDEVRGESAYEADMPVVLADLERKGLTSISDGALVVDLADCNMPPCLLRKADGATLYATRDLAAAVYRQEQYGFTRSLYVTDSGQALHFAQLKVVLERAGHEWAKRITHVPFGLVRLGGKKTGARTGNVVLLLDVLGEAEAQIDATVARTNPDLTPERRREVARDVGVGAIIFANLQSQREKDVDFELEKVLSFDGDAGPYLQYAHARARSVLRRSGVTDVAALASSADAARLARDEEWQLALKLDAIGDEATRAAESCEPHIVAHYLLELCAAYSRWYALGSQDATLRVLCADDATRAARLALDAAFGATLAGGLAMLGMRAPEEM